MQNFSLISGLDNYAVFGNPVTHSKSPQIHTAFARQTSQNIYYQAISVELNEFSASLDRFQNLGGKGLNITVPFKEDAWRSSAMLTDRARRAGAVNTLWFAQDGTRHGDTTDGIGLVRDLTQNHALQLTGLDILILGAGGAVRGIIGALLDMNPGRIVIANRTPARAQELTAVFSEHSELSSCEFPALQGQRFHLIINGTSASLQGEVPPLPDDILHEGATCYDMMYGSTDTAFVTWAKSHHAAQAMDGIGMLVEQAAESFYIWRGVRPDTQAVIQMLRNRD